jgi:putative hydrolase of the HAD superfamily
MAEVSLLLWDVGGVVLSNGWDHRARAAAADRFGLDAGELERRHLTVDAAFETGRLDWAGYLSATVFYETRPFSPEMFRQFMLAQSTENRAALATARALRSSGRYTMAALNNESRELNDYRIRTFGLADVFHVFFSSCYTGLRKPDPAAFRYALDLAQRPAEEALFLDDRPENVEAAARLGLRTLKVQDPGRLREELAGVGVASG